jgi:hypothetical protein
MRDAPDAQNDPEELTPAAPTHTSSRQQQRGTSRPWGVRLLVALPLLLLFVASSCAPITPISDAPTSPTIAVPTAPAPRAQTQAGGLDATLQVLIAGPYFLRELLPVDVSLTNHTQQEVSLLGLSTTANRCHDSALMARLTQGTDPSFAFPPLALGVSCTQEAYLTLVPPGETLTIHQYVPLTRSGAVTLSMQSASASTPTNPLPPNTPVPFPPLDGHWPSLQFQVQPQVPPDRALSLQEQPRHVLVETPTGAQISLLAMQALQCEEPLYLRSDAQWMPLASNVLEEPACPGAHPQWAYLVSAPGYAITSGSQPA